MISVPIKSQILDVPYRSDNGGCGLWCWAKSSQMVIVYYGNDILLCDVLEFVRLSKPSLYNTSDCCLDVDSCCSYGFFYSTINDPRAINTILDNWSIATTSISAPLSTTEMQTELSANRPFAILRERYDPGTTKKSYHVMVAYGYLDGDVYVHDPGNGSAIYDYDDFIVRGSDNIQWINTLTMNSSAASCPLIQHIIGRLKKTASIYKAQQDIYASCIIESTANVSFECGGDIIIEAGFRVDLGGSVVLYPGSSVICP